ncbi:hypothetical protein GCM10010372_23440 [Streptomyces tauricus]|nr:hypothetical protein GCM10010372_23440 [Streptomyces tauricus]
MCQSVQRGYPEAILGGAGPGAGARGPKAGAKPRAPEPGAGPLCGPMGCEIRERRLGSREASAAGCRRQEPLALVPWCRGPWAEGLWCFRCGRWNVWELRASMVVRWCSVIS